jgi:pentatricopeptide repeat protein
MAAQGFIMDSYTYTALMTGEQDHRKIMDGWNQMRTSGIAPTKAAAHEFFRACVAAKDGDAALDALNWMWSLDAPSSLPSSSDATAITRNTTGESNVLSSPTPSSSSTGVTVDVSMCSKVLAALGTQGKTAECMELLSMMRDRGLAPTALCYQIVLSTLEKAGDWQKAVNLLLQVIQFNYIQNLVRRTTKLSCHFKKKKYLCRNADSYAPRNRCKQEAVCASTTVPSTL